MKNKRRYYEVHVLNEQNEWAPRYILSGSSRLGMFKRAYQQIFGDLFNFSQYVFDEFDDKRWDDAKDDFDELLLLHKSTGSPVIRLLKARPELLGVFPQI
jgi:hypothetical protein